MLNWLLVAGWLASWFDRLIDGRSDWFR